MTRQLCIHGHFYQPPREDPWLGRIMIEASAAPMRHWNERIVHESYGPLGWARRLGHDGRITDIVNCYEWISFNAGPTLLSWMVRHTPRVYERILEADAVSLARWGHGNAIAQVYHHIIMPLATPLDRELETAWALADFRARFGREAEGMWLSECAVDTPTLETLAAKGVRFVILSPRQAAAVAAPGQEFRPVEEGTLSVQEPYRIDLPSGASMAVFFYHGALSQAVAFEGLLQDGERFWARLRDAAGPGLLTLSTDGETYGHHFAFGEMALAYVLGQGYAGRDGLSLTNPAAYLAAHAPVLRVRLHEPSSWSCAHGVERWRADCGCSDGGHQGWNQRWRGPLRTALAKAKEALDSHFFSAGKGCMTDPRAALLDYGTVLADPQRADEFSARHMRCEEVGAIDRSWELLAMQEQALAAFASCAWFFDDISRIEPVNAMTFMWRALELARDTGGPDLRPQLEAALALAASNKPEEGTGQDILTHRVLPRQQDAASLCLMALLDLQRENRMPKGGDEATVAWPHAAVHVTPDASGAKNGTDCSGTAMIRTAFEHRGHTVRWRWMPPTARAGEKERKSDTPFIPVRQSRVTVTLADGTVLEKTVPQLPRHVRDYMALSEMTEVAWMEHERTDAAARHAVSLLREWEEGQQNLPYPEYWASLAPQLILACITEKAITDPVRIQITEFLRGLSLCQATRQRAHSLLETAMHKSLLTASPDWTLLALWVVRGRALLPDMNWWSTQNIFWQLGPISEAKQALARALGFRV